METIAQLKEQVLACTACKLAATRTNPVFGGGNPGARVLLVGEGPGEQEDLSGQPFVGRAGKLWINVGGRWPFPRR